MQDDTGASRWMRFRIGFQPSITTLFVAVVHGHAHRGAYEGRTPGGAPVYNVAMHIEKPNGRPYALLEI